MEKHIYFVRHGESEENVGKIHRGPEAALTEKGKEQAQAVAERIERIGVDALISSPFTRALDTARAIKEKLGLEIEENKLLAEWVPPSETIGLHREHPEMQVIFDKILKTFDDPHFRHSDEETFAELVARASAVLAMLAEHPSERICVVTHGGFLRIVVGTLVFGKDFNKKQFFDMRERMRTWNTGITYAELSDGVWRLVTWNDISHFG